MLAAVLHGPRDIRIEKRGLLIPGPGEAVVRVSASGLCGTDYRIWSGDRPVTYPLVMGHEFIGEVEAVGPDVHALHPGQKVAVEPNFSCGVCPLCREGNRNLCLSRTAVGIDVNGGFAEQACLPARCCWPAPAGVSDDQLMLAEPLAVVVRAVARGDASQGESAAVLGVGALGLLAIQVLKAKGLRVLAVGRTDRRERLARALGADGFATTETGGGVDAARAFSGREGVDLVIETAGTARAVEQALELAHPGGRVVLTGLPHEASTVNFFSIVRREIRIVGSMIYREEFPESIRLLSQGTVLVDRLVTHRFPLDRIQEAFAAHRSPDAIKVSVTT
ncbi:MAG TPA: alcohol dehydrogenase catalytic domain-containing protein [Terriglobales bacterium]|nr:alcohol dehydrogenase catalytic domain-containing protein [Terriglobales bacterium]